MKFLYELFYEEFHKTIIRLIQYIIFLFSFLVLVTKPIFFSNTQIFFQIFVLFITVYTLYCLFLALKRRRLGAKAFLAGLLIFFMTVLNDVLHTNEIIITGQLTPLGVFLLIASQDYIISKLFSVSFDEEIKAKKESDEQRILVLKAKKEIEVLSKPKDEFLGNLSHELKTPLSSIFYNKPKGEIFISCT